MEMTKKLVTEHLGISPEVFDMVSRAEEAIRPCYERLDDIMTYNQYKILAAFQKNSISDRHFAWSTGYGYDDAGREAVENVYSDIFHTESSLVRTQIVNGTHALTITLIGILRPGDEMIYCTGGPYDTLEEVIGIRGEGKGSLKDYGIKYKEVELRPDGNIDLAKLKETIGPDTKMVCIQRATGYSRRKAMTISQIKECFDFVKNINKDIVCMTDNCYGEFLDIQEPTDVGADIMAGSLIKNPGGGLALSGGYVTGREDLVENVSYRLTSPALGGECGLTFGQNRTVLQGMFLAPRTVNGAVKGAMLCGKVFEQLGYEVLPSPEEARNDIVQTVTLKTPEKLTAFCEGIQKAAPIDSNITPIPSDTAGYEDKVIMAAGAFVQGSTLELSADGPLREPYNVYFQGGLTYEHSKFGVMMAVQTMKDKGVL